MKAVMLLIAVACAGTATPTTAGPVAADPTSARFRDDLARAAPSLAMLRRYAPATFEKIAVVYEEARRSGRSQDEAIGEARTIFARDQLGRFARAPDTMVLAAHDTQVAVAEDLLARAPERCAALFSGGNAGDIKTFLSAGTIEAEERNFAALWKVPANGPVLAMASPSELQAATASALADAARSLGQEPDEFARGATNRADPAGQCRAQRAFLVAMRRQPDAARTLRAKLAGGVRE